MILAKSEADRRGTLPLSNTPHILWCGEFFYLLLERRYARFPMKGTEQMKCKHCKCKLKGKHYFVYCDKKTHKKQKVCSLNCLISLIALK